MPAGTLPIHELGKVRDQDEQFATRHRDREELVSPTDPYRRDSTFGRRWDQSSCVLGPAPASREMHAIEAEHEVAQPGPGPELTVKPVVRKFDTGATRDDASLKLDFEGFLSPEVLHRFGEFMHKYRFQRDGSLRDSDNWQRGIPLPVYMKSLTRHHLTVWRLHRGASPAFVAKGMGLESVDLEEELCAIIFNAQGYLHEILKAKAQE